MIPDWQSKAASVGGDEPPVVEPGPHRVIPAVEITPERAAHFRERRRIALEATQKGEAEGER